MSTLKVNTLQDASGNNPSSTAQLNKGRAKAWVNFDGTSSGTNKTIRASFNVDSVTDINTGEKYGGVVFPEGVSDDKLGKPIRIEVYAKEYKKNIEHKEEVYFDQVIADALYDYSYRWDSPINNYLRLGD